MSGQFNTGESKFKAQMSIVFEAQMSYRFTGEKAQTSCAHMIKVIFIYVFAVIYPLIIKHVD